MNSSASDKTDSDKTDLGCLAARFVDGPLLSDPVEAERRLAGWLADLEPGQATAIRGFAAQFPQRRGAWRSAVQQANLNPLLSQRLEHLHDRSGASPPRRSPEG